MRSFSKLISLILAFVLGAIGAAYYFHVPINFNPITVVSTGHGDVDIKNEVNQGQPAPANPSTTPKSLAAIPVPTPQETRNESQLEVPRDAVSQPQVSQTLSPGQSMAKFRFHSNHAAPSGSQSYEQECDQPTFQESPQAIPIRWRRNPAIVVPRDDPQQEEFDESNESTAPQTGGYSRSSSSTRIVVNGKVVSSSSVTVINGRVVSRTEFPPPQP
jgi:hypothetical protein